MPIIDITNQNASGTPGATTGQTPLSMQYTSHSDTDSVQSPKQVEMADDFKVTTDEKGIKSISKPSNVEINQDEIKDVSTELEQKLKDLNSKLPPLPVEAPKPANIETQSLLTTEDLVKTQNNSEPNRSMQSQAENLNVTELQSKVYSLDELCTEAIRLNASDLHLTVGYRAIVRVDGSLRSINSQTITPDQMFEYVNKLVVSRKNISVENIEQEDLSYTYQTRRFRVNIFKQKGQYSAVMRLIPERILTTEELMLPNILREFGKLPNGLVLVTGPTGSGKSTTLASILNDINLNQPRHIITLEDPIEFVFPAGVGLIDQREFGIDFSGWQKALRSVLRQDPDVVLVGEMRDYETIATTITISETGHLVFATLHTNSASQTLDRIIDVFPDSQQAQIRAQLANVIAAVVSQRLVPLTSGGRRAATEILIATPAVKNAIREGKTYQIDNMIQTGQDIGMMSMEKSLVSMIKQGLISLDTAKLISNKPDEIDLLMRK